MHLNYKNYISFFKGYHRIQVFTYLIHLYSIGKDTELQFSMQRPRLLRALLYDSLWQPKSPKRFAEVHKILPDVPFSTTKKSRFRTSNVKDKSLPTVWQQTDQLTVLLSNTAVNIDPNKVILNTATLKYT